MVAYLFAGQGSQYIGMGKDLYDTFPESKAVFDKADKVLGFSLSGLCFNGDPAMLKQTHISQPAILTVSIAAWEAFKRVKGQGSRVKGYAAGLSLGEYSALIGAGSLNFEDGLRLVKKRAELMDEAGRKYPGKMAAVIGLSFETIKDICLKSGAEVANINAPEQIVISGKKEAVDKARDLCEEAQAKRVVELEVSGAFHSSLMSEASAELKKYLNNTSFSKPEVAVISNYTAAPEEDISQIKENLIFQMHSPVKWEESMRYILSQGVNKFFEFGPGRVLKGLMRRIDNNAEVVSIEKKEDILGLSEN